jgi:hypothetical protein
VQVSVARLDTAFGHTVEEVAENTHVVRKIPPNAPSKSELDRVKKRVSDLGREWHEFATEAEVSRPVSYALLRGEGSLASLRKIDEHASKEEARRPAQAKNTKANRSSEWAALGAELAELDPDEFDQMLDGLRDLMRAKRLEREAKIKMFRATPDR